MPLETKNTQNHENRNSYSKIVKTKTKKKKKKNVHEICLGLKYANPLNNNNSCTSPLPTERYLFSFYCYQVFFWNSYLWCKQWRPWSYAAFCSVWSGSKLFANVYTVGLCLLMFLFGDTRPKWVKPEICKKCNRFKGVLSYTIKTYMYEPQCQRTYLGAFAPKQIQISLCIHAVIIIFTGRTLDSQGCNFVCVQRSLWLGCADAQVDLNLHWADMSEGMFSDISAYTFCNSGEHVCNDNAN